MARSSGSRAGFTLTQYMGRSIVRAAMKHRIAVFGLVLLAIGAALLFGRQWSSSTESTLIEVEPVTRQAVEPTVERAEPPPVAEAATANATPTATAAAPGGTFRGRAIDAVTRQPVEKFEITLVGVPEGHIVGDEPRVAKTFKSATAASRGDKRPWVTGTSRSPHLAISISISTNSASPRARRRAKSSCRCSVGIPSKVVCSTRSLAQASPRRHVGFRDPGTVASQSESAGRALREDQERRHVRTRRRSERRHDRNGHGEQPCSREIA